MREIALVFPLLDARHSSTDLYMVYTLLQIPIRSYFKEKPQSIPYPNTFCQQP